MITYEPRREKTGLRRGFPTRSDTNRSVEARNFRLNFKKKRHCTIRIAQTKALISFAVTAKLICAFVFAYAKIRFSHDAARWKLSLNAVKFELVLFILHPNCPSLTSKKKIRLEKPVQIHCTESNTQQYISCK